MRPETEKRLGEGATGLKHRAPVCQRRKALPETSGLFWRAVVAFLALPTVIGVLVPWLLVPIQSPFHAVALPFLAAGTTLLLWGVRLFYPVGRGTLAPWAPPKDLVTTGLYRVSRNPMYVAVLIILVGWALAFPSVSLWIYAAAVGLAFHLRVVFYEEPWLARTHGSAWHAFRAEVPRWFGWPTAPVPPGRDVET